MSYHDLRKGRVSEPGRAYFLTTITHHRQPLFADWQPALLLVREMRQMAENGDVESLAWVIMPDHLHWLFILRCDSLTTAMKRLKGRSATKINQCLSRNGPVWQPNYHDHALRDGEDLRQTARYIIANPLRRGLVEDIGQYPLWDAAWLNSREQNGS